MNKTLMKAPLLSSQSINAVYMMIERGIRIVAAVFFGIWIAKILGPSQYGVLQYTLSVVAILSFIGTINLDAILLKELLNNRIQTLKLTTNAIALRFLGSTIVLLICTIWAVISNNNEMSILLLILSANYYFQISDIVDCSFQAQNKYIIPTTTRIFATLISCAIKVYILNKTNDIYIVATLSLIDLICATLLLLIIAKIKKNKLFAANLISSETCRTLLKQSLPLCISSFLVILFIKIDQLALMYFKGPHEVGIYGAMMKIIECWVIIPAIILRAYMPSIIENAKSDNTFLPLMKKYFYTAHAFAIVLILLIFIFSDHIINTLYGASYLDGAETLKIMSLSLLFIFSGEVRAYVFIVRNLTIYHTYSAIIGIPILFLSSAALIPPFGTYGAAVALAASYAITSMGTTFIFPKLRPYIYCQFSFK